MGLKATIRFALKQHLKKNDPYVDDAPGERARAAEHRNACVYCKAALMIEKWHRDEDARIRSLNQLRTTRPTKEDK